MDAHTAQQTPQTTKRVSWKTLLAVLVALVVAVTGVGMFMAQEAKAQELNAAALRWEAAQEAYAAAVANEQSVLGDTSVAEAVKENPIDETIMAAYNDAAAGLITTEQTGAMPQDLARITEDVARLEGLTRASKDRVDAVTVASKNVHSAVEDAMTQATTHNALALKELNAALARAAKVLDTDLGKDATTKTRKALKTEMAVAKKLVKEQAGETVEALNAHTKKIDASRKNILANIDMVKDSGRAQRKAAAQAAQAKAQAQAAQPAGSVPSSSTGGTTWSGSSTSSGTSSKGTTSSSGTSSKGTTSSSGSSASKPQPAATPKPKPTNSGGGWVTTEEDGPDMCMTTTSDGTVKHVPCD